MAHRSGFYQRKLQALEELWPLIAQCSRDQSTIAYQKSEGTDLAPAATALGESRRKLKNYVYDKGLYMDEALRTKIRELDKRLADNTVIDVRTDVRDLEDFLREEARKLTGE